MGTPFDIQVVLTEAEVRSAIAQHIANKLGTSFAVHPSSIEFELENVPGQSVGNDQRFKQITAKVKQR